MASNYKNFDVIRNNVKIYKFQNQRSAVDLTHILGSYREKVKGDNAEYLYAGRVCFSVTDGGNYERAYLTKSKAKLLFQTVLNGTFTKLFNSQYGFQDFGGGTEEGKIYSSKLSINFLNQGKPKFVIQIDKMPGERTATGAYKPKGKPYKTVKTMLDPNDFLEMAIEGSDFIKAAEMAAMIQKKPLHTLTNINFEKVDAEINSRGPQNQPKQKKNPSEMDGQEFHENYLKIKRAYEMYEQEKQRRESFNNNNQNTSA